MDEQRFHLKFSRLVPQISDQATPTFEFSDARARELQSALRQFDGFEAWSESSRSFALLFMLRAGRDWTVLSASAFKDDLLPFPDEALRKIHGLSKEDIGNMLLYQDFFLAPFETVHKLELFKSAEHRPISTGDTHFGLGKELGKSKSALVRRARHRNSNTIFAIKMFSRKIADAYELFRTERSNLQKLNLEKPKHPHLIELIGTYTDEKHFALVLCPAAEYDLAKLLAMDESEGIRIGRREVLRYSFGCLASGLQYLHAKKIRHKDVKPGNILIHNGTVVICDFGISRDWSDDPQDFTNGTVNRQTHRYSSPEVSTERPRDAKADVWSLGCVFLEVVTVLKQRTVADLRNFFQQDPSEDAYYWIHPALAPEWTKELQRNATFNDPLVWIGKMVSQCRKAVFKFELKLMNANSSTPTPRTGLRRRKFFTTYEKCLIRKLSLRNMLESAVRERYSPKSLHRPTRESRKGRSQITTQRFVGRTSGKNLRIVARRRQMTTRGKRLKRLKSPLLHQPKLAQKTTTQTLNRLGHL